MTDTFSHGPAHVLWYQTVSLTALSLQAIQKGNLEGAKIHAENSIRQKNQALNYRRMSARIDAVSARVQTALTMKQVRIPPKLFSARIAAVSARVQTALTMKQVRIPPKLFSARIDAVSARVQTALTMTQVRIPPKLFSVRIDAVSARVCGPQHTKVVKNGTSCSSLGTQIYGVELGLVDPVSG